MAGKLRTVTFAFFRSARFSFTSFLLKLHWLTIRNILPAIGNELIALLKETSVAGYVAVVDLTRAGNLIRNNTFDAVNPLMSVALIYLILVIILTQLLRLLERRLGKSDKR